MDIVAIKAVHLALTYRVAGNQAELGSDIRMAAVAQLGHLFMADLLLGPFVHFVAG